MFLIYYRQERRGRILSFKEGPRGEYRFEFPDVEGTVEVQDLLEIDAPLLESFRKCVDELNVA